MAMIRKAVRMSNTLWGGRYNPIIPLDDPHAASIAANFQIDFVEPVDKDDHEVVRKQFPHLIRPMHIEGLYSRGERYGSAALVLDLENALTSWQENSSEWAALKQDFAVYEWESTDRLSDLFNIVFGSFPDPTECGSDYKNSVIATLSPEVRKIELDGPLPADASFRNCIATLGRWGMKIHHSSRRGQFPFKGIFAGSSDDPNDLITFWNLRASGVPIVFADVESLPRFMPLIDALAERVMNEADANQRRFRELALWSNLERERLPQYFDISKYRVQQAGRGWLSTLEPPSMHIASAASLGVVREKDGKSAPAVTFSLNEKPFSSGSEFAMQLFAASISLRGLYRDLAHTTRPPHVPELNEFFSREMVVDYSELRTEPERFSLLLSATQHDVTVRLLSTYRLFQQIFKIAGYAATLSTAGRIARQLIGQLDGLQGGRVFKIPGVRQLLRSMGPRDTFTKNVGLQRIKGDPGSFSPHKDLYIESRTHANGLTPPDVLSYLVAKGVFRIGVDLTCPNCEMTSWIHVDALRQRATCELCGDEHDASRQLVNAEFAFRRSGLLGTQRDGQGAIPVTLTLQQLDTFLYGFSDRSAVVTSLDLRPLDASAPCEVDFAWLDFGDVERPPTLLLGECKDAGPLDINEFRATLESLCNVAEAFHAKRIEACILYAKLSTFSEAELTIVKELRASRKCKFILLTQQELEPYQAFAHLKEAGKINHVGGTVRDLVRISEEVYFGDP